MKATTTNRLAMAALLPILSVAVSCIETDPTMGYGLIPEDQLLETKVAVLDLPVASKMADSIATTSRTSIVIGSINSSISGRSEYGCATTFAPVADSSVIEIGTNRRIAEFYLDLPLRRAEYINENSRNIIQNIRVYRMTKDFDSTTVYNCSFTEEYYDKSTPISLEGTTYNGGDTLHILLSTDYAEEILDMLARNPSIVDTISNYNKEFHGIYITAASPMSGIDEGRINNFKIQSYGRIRYTGDFGDRKDVDTTVIFRTGLTDLLSNTYFALNTSTLDNTGKETPSTADKIRIDGNAGYKPVVSSSYMASAIEELASRENTTSDRIMISRATIRMPFEFPADYTAIDNSYPQILSPSIRFHAENGRVIYTCITDVSISDEDPGYINRSLGYYSPDITHYLQRLLKQQKDEISEDDDIWLMPTTDSPDKNDEESSSEDESYYNYYDPFYYYDPYGYYDYGYGYGYGYGGYYGYNPYGYYGSSYYGDAETESDGITLDNLSYFSAELNGTGAERKPQLIITYFVLPEETE